MWKKISSFLLIVLSLNVIGISSVYADDAAGKKEARLIRKVKERIGKIGTGSEARVEAELRNKTKLKGYVSQANTDSFTIIGQNGLATEVAYSEVRQIKGHNRLSSETIGVLVALGILAGTIILIATVGAGN